MLEIELSFLLCWLVQEEAEAAQNGSKKRKGPGSKAKGPPAAGGKKKERWQFDGRPDFDAEPFKAGPRSKVRLRLHVALPQCTNLLAVTMQP